MFVCFVAITRPQNEYVNISHILGFECGQVKSHNWSILCKCKIIHQRPTWLKSLIGFYNEVLLISLTDRDFFMYLDQMKFVLYVQCPGCLVS